MARSFPGSPAHEAHMAALQVLLRHAPTSTDRLAAAIGKNPSWVDDRMFELEEDGSVVDVGPPGRAVWVWRVGDVPAGELRVLVEKLLAELPLCARDLVAITGAPAKKIDAVLVDVRRAHPDRLVDASTENKPHGRAVRYFLLPSAASSAGLVRKR